MSEVAAPDYNFNSCCKLSAFQSTTSIHAFFCHPSWSRPRAFYHGRFLPYLVFFKYTMEIGRNTSPRFLWLDQEVQKQRWRQPFSLCGTHHHDLFEKKKLVSAFHNLSFLLDENRANPSWQRVSSSLCGQPDTILVGNIGLRFGSQFIDDSIPCTTTSGFQTRLVEQPSQVVTAQSHPRPPVIGTMELSIETRKKH